MPQPLHRMLCGSL